MSIQFLCSLKKQNKTGLFIMSLTILFFHSDLDAFSFSCPAALARIIVIMLNKNGQSREYVCLVPGLRGKKR